MSRAATPLFAVLALAATTTAAAATEPSRTVRIETKPAYGATVTLEEGVRVFRALPSEQLVIVNPNGDTPLGLTFGDARDGYLPRR